jgi:hypothetical protein
MIAENFDTDFFVMCIDPTIGDVFALVMKQVAKIVEKSGSNKRRLRAFTLDEPRGLQAVLEHGDRLAEVGFAAALGKQIEDPIEGRDGLHCLYASAVLRFC